MYNVFSWSPLVKFYSSKLTHSLIVTTDENMATRWRNILENHTFFMGLNKKAAIAYHPLCVEYCK